jgi:hypothetical protein
MMPTIPNDLSLYDEVVVPDLTTAKKASPLSEMGASGLKHAAGVVDEEFLPALRGRKAIQVYREMSMNDPTVGSLLFTINQLLRAVTWRVEAPDNTPDSTKASDFIESCMDDMSHTWDDMISDILTDLVYGWSWHEVVYKKRIGPWEKDPKKKSKYDDGLIGWRKIPIRAQETWQRWMFDADGGIKGMVQLAPPMYQSVLIPIEKSLLFRFSTVKNNPEGQSMLRNSYRPWFFKKRLEEFEAIGVERDLAGMPVAKVPVEYMEAAQKSPNSDKAKVYASFKKLVSNVRRDEHEGIVLPAMYDKDTKQPLFEFELMSAGGSRQFDTSGIIQRYEQRILMTVLADFIMVGHEGTGSYALHVDKTGIFRAALNSIAQSIADVFNRHAIPRLFELNAWKMDELPKIVPNNVDPPDLTQLAGFMTSMGGLGMEWFPDPELEKFLRETAHLPELPDEVLEMRRQMALQHNVMTAADQQMQFMGMKQKAELIGRGFSPEQAQMSAAQPNEEMSAQEQVAQYKGQAMADEDPAVAGAKEKELTTMQQQQMAAKGDPVGEHGATAAIDEDRATKEHARAKEMDKIKSKGATRDDVLAQRAHQRQLALEKLKQKGAEQKAKAAAKKPPPKSKAKK